MTNKEFFLETMKSERKIFRDAIEALPDDKFGHKVHDRSREAGNLALQLAAQWESVSNIIKKGSPHADSFKTTAPTKANVLDLFDKNFDQMMKDVASVSDDEWENKTAKMEYPGGSWEVKKFEMAWGFLLDAVHHRGQLSTFLRHMGAKVPSIYGGSADTQAG
jgi:uncharacterized damage-inducible protein DinB